MKGIIKIGIVGAGWPAWQHIKSFKNIDGVRVTALCDINEKQLDKIADEYDIPRRFVRLEDMLNEKQIDAVVICTPNYLHVPQAILALKAGKHVLCEKPLSINAAEARKIRVYLKRSKKIFMLAHVYRFREESQYLKDIINRGELGSIYFASAFVLRREGIPGYGGWFTTKAKAGGGALIDCGVHMLDLVWWLMGSPRPVCAFGITYAKFGPHRLRTQPWGVSQITGKPIFDVEDFAAGIIKMADGSSILIEAAWALNIKEPATVIDCRLYGTEGGVTYNPFSHTAVDIIRYINNRPHFIQPEFSERNAFYTQAKHFIDCIRKNTSPLIQLEDGINIMKMMDAIYKSSKMNRSVDI